MDQYTTEVSKQSKQSTHLDEEFFLIDWLYKPVYWDVNTSFCILYHHVAQRIHNVKEPNRKHGYLRFGQYFLIKVFHFLVTLIS